MDDTKASVTPKSRAKAKTKGRHGAPNKSRLGQVRFSEGLWRTLKREAGSRETTVSALIRTLCIEGLQRRGWFGGAARTHI